MGQNAALAARQIRKTVMEVRNLKNQSLGENEKPADWDAFTPPFLDRCRLLLQLPQLVRGVRPLSAVKDISDSRKRLIGAALQVKPPSPPPHTHHLHTARERKERRNGGGLQVKRTRSKGPQAFDQWDNVLASVQAASVYRRSALPPFPLPPTASASAPARACVCVCSRAYPFARARDQHACVHEHLHEALCVSCLGQSASAGCKTTTTLPASRAPG